MLLTLAAVIATTSVVITAGIATVVVDVYSNTKTWYQVEHQIVL